VSVPYTDCVYTRSKYMVHTRGTLYAPTKYVHPCMHACVRAHMHSTAHIDQCMHAVMQHHCWHMHFHVHMHPYRRHTRTLRSTHAHARRYADTQVYRYEDTHARRHADTQTRRHTDTQTRRHADTQTRRHADTQGERRSECSHQRPAAPTLYARMTRRQPRACTPLMHVCMHARARADTQHASNNVCLRKSMRAAHL
jgi:hypothetical protein